jgi:hypothetical protein
MFMLVFSGLLGGLYGMKYLELGALGGSVRSNATRTSWEDDEVGVGRKSFRMSI